MREMWETPVQVPPLDGIGPGLRHLSADYSNHCAMGYSNVEAPSLFPVEAIEILISS